MNITIIGASAGLGLVTVNHALKMGHTVTTLSRSKLKGVTHANLHPVQGDALDEADLRKVIKGSDAVLVTLGTRGKMEATTLFSDFAGVLVGLHEKEPVNVPVVVITGFAAGESYHYMVPILKPLLKIFLNKVYQDKTKMEEIVTQSSLRWEIVRPGLMTNFRFTGKYRVETGLRKGMNIWAISRKDVADYLVKEAEQQKHLREYIALSL